MRIDYAPRAIRDLEEIGAYYRAVTIPPVAAAIAERLERVISRLAFQPQSAPRVVDRPGVRAVLVRRYPYRFSIEFEAMLSRFFTSATRRAGHGTTHDANE